MSAPSHSDASDDELARLLSAAFEGSGRPTMPAGRRVQVISLLTGLIADKRRLESYASTPGFESQPREADAPPDPAIVAEGFSALPDDELAALALSPRALVALRGHLEDPENRCGEWFPRAVIAAHVGRPEVKELVEHARRRVARLIAERNATILKIPPAQKPRGWAPKAVQWGRKLAPLAASLLVGVLLGTTAFRSGGEPSSFDVSVASVPSPTRGPGERPGVKVEIRGEGFVALVALAPGRRPEVVPGLGVDDVPVKEGSPAVVQLPESTTEVLSVVTETPASEPLRRALREKAFEPGQLEGLKAFVRAALEAKGFRRMALETTILAK